MTSTVFIGIYLDLEKTKTCKLYFDGPKSIQKLFMYFDIIFLVGDGV